MNRIVTPLASIFSTYLRRIPSAENCDSESKFTPLTVKLMPDPLIVGNNMDMTVVFQNEYDIITSGIQKIKVTFNGMTITPPVKSICDYNNDLCPIQIGAHAINNTFVTPDVTGTGTMKIGWFTDDGTSLLCVQQNFEIKPPSK